MIDKLNRRFVVEELDNGVLVKISPVTGSDRDKVIGRYAFQTVDEMLPWLVIKLKG